MHNARDQLLHGDLSGLASSLAEHPGLVDRRWPGDEIPYDGYFHGATLLHHVAGNPLLVPLPDNVGEAALLLLEGGADVDEVTLAGPSQPDDPGWTALGLVATSAQARKAGVQSGLLHLLLDRGADPDALNGGALMGALYYGESAAAEELALAGAYLDLVAAAGVGDLVRLRELLARGREALLTGRRLRHYSRTPWPEGADPDARIDHLLGMALVYAALHGRAGALELLLDAGADPDHRPPFDHGGTALHWAVMGDRPDSVRTLLRAGADPGVRDREFDGTPADWARHLGRPKASEALR